MEIAAEEERGIILILNYDDDRNSKIIRPDFHGDASIGWACAVGIVCGL